MANQVKIDVMANTVGAVRSVQNLERSLSAMGKRLAETLGRGVGDQGAKAVGSMTREMQRLEKQTTTTQRQLENLQKLLGDVNKQHGAAMAGGPAQSGQAALLARQQRALELQVLRTQTRLTNLQGLKQVEGDRKDDGGGSGRRGGFLGDLAQGMGGAGKFLGPIAGALGIAGIGALVGKAVVTAIEEEKQQADFASRMLGVYGGLGSERKYNLDVRKAGLGLGYTSQESREVFGAMASGGGHLGGPLERDSRVAMEMGRLFGLDAGSQAGLLAGAQRTGAVKPGEARKFAEMLGSQIARTGLGPRAQEVQEATLQLLHMQMSDRPEAQAAGGIMQLATILNKSGIAGFQGQFGASFIQNLQGRVTGTGAPREEALKQMIFARMGVKDFLGMERAKEEGLNNPDLLPKMFDTVMGMSPTKGHGQFIMKEAFGISFAQSDALMKRFPGGIKAGDFKEAQAILQGGKGGLAAGAASAMELPGNKLRDIEAVLHDIMISGAEPLVEMGVEQVKKLTDIWTESQTIADMTTRIAEKVWGLKPGEMSPMRFDSAGEVGKSALKMGTGMTYIDKKGGGVNWKKILDDATFLLNPGAAIGQEMMHQRFGPALGPKMRGGSGSPTAWKDEVKKLGDLLGADVSSENRPGATTVTGKPSRHGRGRALDFTGTRSELSAMFEAIQNQYPGQIDELFYTPKGSIKYNKFYKPGTFNRDVERTHDDHLHVSLGDHSQSRTLRVVVENGEVNPDGRRALDNHLNRWAAGKNEEKVKTGPNRRNPR